MPCRNENSKRQREEQENIPPKRVKLERAAKKLTLEITPAPQLLREQLLPKELSDVFENQNLIFVTKTIWPE
jgi:hypothetical protein